MGRPGIYQHYKGNYYQVVDVARMDETHEEYTIYRPLYVTPDKHFGHLMLRRTTEFHEKVKIDTGETSHSGTTLYKLVDRFTWVSDTPWERHSGYEWVPSGSDI